MYSIYVDNFRSFRDTIIPIKDVNFLVGENSTGKTSIMSLIYFLLSPFMVMSGADFNRDEETYDLGSATDLSHSGKNVVFGIASENYSSSDKNSISALLQVFSISKGGLVLKKIMYCDSLHHVYAEVEGKGLYYKTGNIDKNKKPIDYLNMWRKFVVTDRTSLKRIVKARLGNSNLFEIRQAIELELVHNKIAGKSFTIPNTTFQEHANWVAPIRSKAQKIYVGQKPNYSPEGQHIAYMLNDLKLDSDVWNVLDNFGKESGLWSSLKIKRYESDAHSSPFLIQAKNGKYNENIAFMGYGVSQVLPIIANYSVFHSWIFIQQPEIHLHPKAQASLGGYFFNQGLKNKHYLIETHSDFIIDRFRVCINKYKNKIKIPTSQILYFEKKGNINTVTPVPINKSGGYVQPVPRNFRDFFIKEEISKLKL